MSSAKQSHDDSQTKKFRRGHPEALGALASLVSFDDPSDPESSPSRRPGKGLPPPNAGSVQTSGRAGASRLPSAPLPFGTTLRRHDQSIRKVLSQDWLRSGYSPRPGKVSNRRSMFIGVGIHPTRRLSNMPSLASISEVNEDEDREDGSELSDEPCPTEDAQIPQEPLSPVKTQHERVSGEATRQ